jgi:hypothetical protein
MSTRRTVSAGAVSLCSVIAETDRQLISAVVISKFFFIR